MNKIIIIPLVALVFFWFGEEKNRTEFSNVATTTTKANQVQTVKSSSVKIPNPVTSTLNISYLIKGTGGRLDWSDSKKLLVFDRVDENGYAKIWTMDMNGASQKCITCNNQVLPKKHQGNPEWHPSGKYIAIQVADPSLEGAFAGNVLHKLATSPGAGSQNNIWIISSDGDKAWQMTYVKKEGGILHPQFSNDGKKIMWAEATGPKGLIGVWEIKIADFYEENHIPKIKNIETLKPGGLLWYETHDFSPDNTKILFSGMGWNGAGEKDFDVYIYDLKTKDLKILTDNSLKQWDEHAHFTSDGKQIIWMSSMGSGQKPSEITQLFVKTDYWVMDVDGKNKKQITFFNKDSSTRVISADLSISMDEKYLFGYIQDPGTGTKPGSIVRMNLK